MHIAIFAKLCDGCDDCVKACQEAMGEARIKIHKFNDTYIPLLCRRCEDAPCRRVCIVKDEESCVGCRMCMLLCPWDGLFLSKDGKVVRCSLCKDKESPPCVVVCKEKGALKVEDVENFVHKKREDFAQSFFPG